MSSLLSPQATQGLAAFMGGSALVELSGLGQLLSAVSMFQSSLANLQPGSTNSGIGQNFGTDFASLAAEAQSFVDSFNGLQSRLAGLQGPFGALGGEPFAGQFSDALNAQAMARLNNGDSALTSLAKIGIDFQPVSTLGGGGRLSINLQAMQTAFTADPTGAFALLGEAVQMFGGLAASFAGQAGSAAAALGSVAQFGLGQTGFGRQGLSELFELPSFSQLNTFNGGLSSLFGAGLTGAGSLGLADLFALQAFNPGNATTFAQQLLALNQFNLVSSLLG